VLSLTVEDEKMTLSQNIGLKKRSAALHVKGADSFRFLNGMLTQDVQKTLPACIGSRSFFLTNKGKIIAPLYFLSLNQEELCIWTEESAFEALHQGLERFLIADKVTLTPMGSLDSWSLVQSEFACEALKTRHPLGLEKIFPARMTDSFYVVPQQRLSPSHAEVLSLKNEFIAQEISKEEYLSYCLKSGTPEWGVDMFADDFFLEFPLADSVSFDKGCYVGQETVARGTFRGKVNKSYARIESNKTLSVGDVFNESGDKVGHIRSVQGNIGSGIIKFDINKDAPFVLNGDIHTLHIEHLVNEETYRKGR